MKIKFLKREGNLFIYFEEPPWGIQEEEEVIKVEEEDLVEEAGWTGMPVLREKFGNKNQLKNMSSTHILFQQNSMHPMLA